MQTLQQRLQLTIAANSRANRVTDTQQSHAKRDAVLGTAGQTADSVAAKGGIAIMPAMAYAEIVLPASL